MTILEFSPSEHAHPAFERRSDRDFERRWTAWKMRGAARERVVRQRVTIVGVVTALTAVVAYGLFSL